MNAPFVVSKARLMELVARGSNRECFEHSEAGIFDITAMREAIKARAIPYMLHEVTLIQITGFIRTNRDVEAARVNTLPYDSWWSDPGIFLNCPDGTHLMVDGHHRALRREIEHLETMWFHFVDLRHACRPTQGWVKNPFLDWGEADMVDGKLVRRS